MTRSPTSAQVADALDDLHRQHVVHLDVKPSNIMFRPSGEAVMLDYGLSHHEQLPDLMQEEFRLPFGTAPYMSPEQFLGIRNDPRSDLFALGVLLISSPPACGRLAKARRMGGMRRRLWRDPMPPRGLRPDYPPWLQEIVLRCLEVEPAWRYPTASSSPSISSHHDQVKLTARSERLTRDPWTTALRRRFNKDLKKSIARPAIATQLACRADRRGRHRSSPRAHRRRSTMRCVITAERILATLPSARLACLNVLKLGRDHHRHLARHRRATTSRSTAWSRSGIGRSR